MGLFCAVMASGFAVVPQAKASFMDYYDFNNFTQTSTSDGFAFTGDGGLTAVVVGGNDGSGLFGTTTVTITAPAPGTVQFNYLYNSLDSPTFDTSGYLLNGVYTQFADTDGETGTASFSVSSGDSFGFEVLTQDNSGEPGILTVSDFTAPADSPAVPEPGTLSLAVLGAAVVAAYIRIKRGGTENEENA